MTPIIGKGWLCVGGASGRNERLTATRIHRSSMTSPSANVVPLLSIIQNKAVTLGFDRISHLRLMFCSQRLARVEKHVIFGATTNITNNNN